MGSKSILSHCVVFGCWTLLLLMTSLNGVSYMAQSTEAVPSANDSKIQEAKIRVNTIWINHDNGTKSNIRNTSQIVQGYDGLIKLLQNHTANTYSPDTRGIVFNNVTGTILIPKDLNSTHYALADVVANEIQKGVPICYIEEVISHPGGIPTYYPKCVWE